MKQDQLELGNLALDAKKQKRAMKWASLCGGVILSLWFITVVLSLLSISSGTHYQGFVQTETGWQPMSGIQGNPVHVQSSISGTVWVQTIHPDALYRWDGLSWQQYQNFGLENAALGTFALDRETVWVATDRGISHFDGKKWEPFPKAIDDDPKSMTVSDQGVFVIGCDGELLRYHKEAWTTTDVRAIVSDMEDESSYCYPQLMSMSDGRVYLEWNGIWRFDGEQWTEARVAHVESTNGVRLAGDSKNGFWTSWGDYGLVWSEFSLMDWRVYSLADMGLPDNVWVMEVLYSGGKNLVATSDGLIQYDGTTWEEYPTPETQSRFYQIAASSNGKLWAVTIQQSSAIVWFIGATVMIILIIVTLIAFIILLIWIRRQQLRRVTEARHLLAQIMPDVDQPKLSSVGRLVYVLQGALLVVVGGGLYYIMRVAGTAGFLLLAMVLPIGLIGGVIIWKQKYGRLPNTKRPFANGTAIILTTIWTGLFVVGMVWFGEISTASSLVFFIVWCGIALIAAFFPYWWIYRMPLSSGNYAEAIKRAERLRRWMPDTASILFYQGTILLIAGRYVESESVLRECISRLGNRQPFIQATALNNLSEALAGQGRYDEAVDIVEIAIQLWPQLTTCYSTLAELYLEYGDNPSRALEIIEFSQKFNSGMLIYRILEPHHSAIRWVLKAWALAQLHQNDEIDALIQKALRKTQSGLRLGQSAVNYMIGRVKQEQGDSAQATEYFNFALRLDSQGMYVKRITAMLDNAAK